jgi:plasmid stabilization system protein ParE
VSYTLHPSAARDLDEACLHYRKSASARLALRFLNEFERTAGLLAREPGLGTPIRDGRAVFPLRAFPYSVIYKPAGAGVRILVVRHQHRDPDYGTERR